MSVLLIIVLVGALLVAAAVAHEKRRQRGFDEWRLTAQELGLSLTGGDDAWSMGGELNGVPVRADFRRRVLTGRESAGEALRGFEETTSFFAGRLPGSERRDGRAERTTGTSSSAIPETLVVHEDTLARSLGRFVEGRDGPDGQSGDAPFDALVELPQMDAYVCAALSFAAREQLRSLIERGGQVRQGRVVYERRVAVSHDRTWLVPLLKSLSRLARALSVTPDALHRRLVDNATHDPIPAVRLKNLRFLSDPSTRTPAGLVASTARALLTDVSAPVRSLAARQLPAEGRPVLGALAADPRLETALRVEALRALDEQGVPDPELLIRLLGANPPELASFALSLIAARRLDGLSDAVVECAESEHATVRAAAASALARLPAQRAQEVLLRLLSDPSDDVQHASVEALGVIGNVAAVEPLLPLAEGLGRAPLRQAARAAMGRIQSRLGQVEAGRLSLADERPLAGALALAEAQATRVGEVSLADSDELSPASEGPLPRPPRTEQ